MHALTTSALDRGRKISVEGLISLSNHPVRTLFYSGASHSFILSSVVESLHLITSMVVDPVVVSKPHWWFGSFIDDLPRFENICVRCRV